MENLLTNLEYKHLVIYANSDIRLTLKCIYRGGELIEYQHGQIIDRIFFDYGYTDLHTEPFSTREPINRYYLELYPLSIFEKTSAEELMEKFNCSLKNIEEVFALILNKIKVDDISYSTYKMLTENKIDFLNFIENNIALNILEIE